MAGPIDAITKMPPRTMALIGAGGLAAGLLWRRFSNRSSGAMPGSLPYPEDVNGLAMDTVGNIGGDNRRDLVNAGFNLPGVSWLFTDTQGDRWLTDGSNYTPVDSVTDYDVPVAEVASSGMLGPKVIYSDPQGRVPDSIGTWDPSKGMYKFTPGTGGSKDGYIRATNSWLRRAPA